MRRLFIGVLLLGAFACGGKNSPTAPSTSLSGTWLGTVTAAGFPAGNVRMTIAQSGASLSGTWGTTYQDSTLNGSGSLSGNVAGANVTVVLSPSIPTSCPFNVVATVNGSTMSGTFAAFNCSVTSSGGFSVTKQ